MCQLCIIRDIGAQDRWPKPLEHHKADIDLLITSSHDTWTAFATEKRSPKDVTAPDVLLELLRLLATVLEELENDRVQWWSSPEKREQRRRLEEECKQPQLTQLHKINNSTADRIENMSAKLGAFCKWSLGMNGSLWELQNGDKVAKEWHAEPQANSGKRRSLVKFVHRPLYPELRTSARG